jgi:hypothetical protein
MPAQTVIKLRRGTAAQWTAAQTAAGATPVLAAGEQGYETDTGKLKIGDGTALWGALSYANLGGAIPQTQVTNLPLFNASSPAQDQVLMYNSTTQRWVNAPLPTLHPLLLIGA